MAKPSPSVIVLLKGIGVSNYYRSPYPFSGFI